MKKVGIVSLLVCLLLTLTALYLPVTAFMADGATDNVPSGNHSDSNCHSYSYSNSDADADADTDG